MSFHALIDNNTFNSSTAGGNTYGGYWIGDTSSSISSGSYPLTLGIWVKLEFNESNGQYFRPIITIMRGDNAGWLGIIYDANQIGLNYSSGVQNLYNFPLAVGRWQHLCLVYSTATSRKLYLNGKLIATETVFFSQVTLSQIYVGSSVNVTGGYVGSGFCFDEVAIFDKALSDAQVFQLANGERMGLRARNIHKIGYSYPIKTENYTDASIGSGIPAGVFGAQQFPTIGGNWIADNDSPIYTKPQSILSPSSARRRIFVVS